MQVHSRPITSTHGQSVLRHNKHTIYKTNTKWKHNANRCVDFALRRHQKELNEKKLVHLEAMLHLKESELQVLCTHAHANISRT
jgi:hypothetical protein